MLILGLTKQSLDITDHLTCEANQQPRLITRRCRNLHPAPHQPDCRRPFAPPVRRAAHSNLFGTFSYFALPVPGRHTPGRQFGSLLVAARDREGQLQLLGTVGVGFSDAARTALQRELDGLAVEAPPVAGEVPWGARPGRARECG
ncbi:ATP dependent DNA ligase [Nocardia sp. NPDC003963]